MDSNVNFKYYAFISYSHEDTEFAQLIQKKLTEYKLPSVIRKANPLLPSNVRPIFRDATNLTTGMLQGTLHSELEHSKFLIVLCSPNSARPNDENKHWVNKEVKHFIELGRAEFIIPVIVGGEPHATNPEEECFCPALLSLPGGDELLGIDIRDGKKKRLPFGKALKRKLGIPDEDDLEEKATVHIVAKMLGLGVDDLWNWDKKARKRKAYARLSTIATLFIVMLTAGLFVYFKKFHIYHEYYIDCTERWLVPEGIHKLKKRDIKQRAYSYRLDIQNGKVIKCVFIGNDGSPKKNTSLGDNPYIFNQNLISSSYEYKANSTIPSIIKNYSLNNKLEAEYEIIQVDTNIFRVNISKKSEGIVTQGVVISSIWGETTAKISSAEFILSEDGFICRKYYYKFHDDNTIGFTSDNICGQEISRDNLGRPLSVKYL